MDFEKIYQLNEAKKEHKFTLITPLVGADDKTFSDLSETKNAIFLAGPCPRKNYEREDWRNEAFKILDNLNFNGTVLNPTNKYYAKYCDSANTLKNQTDWELEAMHRASVIVFNLDKSEEHPGFTTNVEFGFYSKYPSIYVYKPKDNKYGANNYIKILCEEKGIPVFETLEDTLAAAVRDLERSGKNWYISDTHFGQERTLNFSRRPYTTTKQMDLDIISNWNKRIRQSDTVYFLGDFGESASYLDGLNFKEMNFVTGNYERDKLPDVLKAIKKYDNVKVWKNDECTVESNGFKYILRHEPVIGEKIPKDYLCIFGHIHGRALVKENGIDVGIDAHHMCPTPQEEIDFFANAIKQNYYDENVFSSKCC